MRIVSLLPSATEIVFALGLGDRLVGVSHECDYPPEARRKPVMVRSRVDPSRLDSRGIDRRVAELTAAGQPIYELDVRALRAARPDLVITQALCPVCAVPYGQVESALEGLRPPPQVVSLDPHGLEDVLRDILRVGEATGRTAQARRVVDGLRARVEAVRERSKRAEHRPRVVCLEWLDPVIVAGHWVPEMVALAGGRDALARPGEPSRRVPFDEVEAADAEVLVAMPCGMDVARTVRELSALEDLGRWLALPAFRHERAYAVDAASHFSRSGPRLVEALELLARAVHPELWSDAPPVGPHLLMALDPSTLAKARGS